MVDLPETVHELSAEVMAHVAGGMRSLGSISFGRMFANAAATKLITLSSDGLTRDVADD